MVSLSTMSLTPFGDANFFPQSLMGRGLPSSFHWRNSGAGNERERVYTLVIGVLCPLPVVVRCLRIQLWRKVQRQTICSDSTQSRSAKYLFCKARTSGANVFDLMFFVYFLFLKAPFMLSLTVHFYWHRFCLPSTFFCFCNTCSFVTCRTSFGVADPNIILLYSGVASSTIVARFLIYRAVVLKCNRLCLATILQI